MTKQKTPHTQTQQNTTPEQSDIDPNEPELSMDELTGQNFEGAETGQDRAPRKVQTRSSRKSVESPTVAYEGTVKTRTPKGNVQGITSHSATEESERQEKVVRDRPDAQAGVNHSNREKRRAS